MALKACLVQCDPVLCLFFFSYTILMLTCELMQIVLLSLTSNDSFFSLYLYIFCRNVLNFSFLDVLKLVI